MRNLIQDRPAASVEATRGTRSNIWLTAASATLAASVLVLSACDVEKTKEGNVTVPAYEVKKTQEGNVTLPKYDVTAPTVDVGTKQETVTVPTVKMEEKTITVPSIDLKSADEVKKEKTQ